MHRNPHQDDTTRDADIRRTLSLNLRLLRLLNGWSQEQLAERSGLHRTYVGAVERGETSIGIDNLQRLARALGTSPGALLEFAHHEPPQRIGEVVATYTGRYSMPATVSAQTRRQNVVDMRQYAMFRLWTMFQHSRVMTPHESQCKEAAGPAGATDAYPARLVTGSTRRTQRTQPQLYRRGRARRA